MTEPIVSDGLWLAQCSGTQWEFHVGKSIGFSIDRDALVQDASGCRHQLFPRASRLFKEIGGLKAETHLPGVLVQLSRQVYCLATPSWLPNCLSVPVSAA